MFGMKGRQVEKSIRYRVDIDVANETKAGLSEFIDGKDSRLLNRVGAFASLFALDLARYRDPVLVLKTEEPGSKQVLAFQHDRIESVCEDMINHLVNDCIAMGAEPLAVQDLVVCGRMEKSVVTRIVAAIASACRTQECVLTGGETTEQPDVVPAGTYILASSIVGVVNRDRVVDGSAIRVGDAVIALASSGPHTNGYTLIRDLLASDPSLASRPLSGGTFLEAVLVPHRCYYRALKGLFEGGMISGLAHITGGGIRENLDRILPRNVDAAIDLAAYRVSPIFTAIRDAGRVSDEQMIRTFNLGVGMAVVCRQGTTEQVIAHLQSHGETAYRIGAIVEGRQGVRCMGELRYPQTGS